MSTLRSRLSFEEAAERARFSLVYSRDDRRRFAEDGIWGEQIDNADEDASSASPGEWSHDFPTTQEPQQWFRYFMRAAVSEAIHEALEWYQVDGRPVLDPHDPMKSDRIFAMCDRFADRLWSLSQTEIGEGDVTDENSGR